MWLLAEGLLLTDEDAASLSTYGAMGKDHLLAMRNRRQTLFGLAVATVGFVGQAMGLLFPFVAGA